LAHSSPPTKKPLPARHPHQKSKSHSDLLTHRRKQNRGCSWPTLRRDQPDMQRIRSPLPGGRKARTTHLKNGRMTPVTESAGRRESRAKCSPRPAGRNNVKNQYASQQALTRRPCKKLKKTLLIYMKMEPVSSNEREESRPVTRFF